ncbi:hypothetical protein HCN44_007581 [Aphidius gifuensis]|uniref:AMP-dependent synthetase/ligase domain-containing protein n=1 Tax=Aphidius gifuensis TaxID=684658 RepID=A0A834XM60_APHGI|nr:hypothetical protein HCN44_007581 [Aphidius gifuensis]
MKNASSFKIENGIIKGEECPFVDPNYNNCGEMLLEKMKNNVNTVGQVDAETGKEDTFGDMMDRSIRCALWMKNKNLKPGDVVAICTNNHLDSIILCLASLYIGVVFNPWIDFGLTKDVMRHFINLTKPKVLFTNEETIQTVLEVAREENINIEIIVFGSVPGFLSFNDIINKQEKLKVENFECTKFQSVDQPAVILYTSGTSGLQKGVLLSHKSIHGNIKLMANISDASCTALVYSSLCWNTGIICPFSFIAQNSKRIVANDFSGKQLCGFVEKYKINWILLGTSLANRLVTSGEMSKYDMSSIKYLWITGSMFKEETQRKIQKLIPSAHIFQRYGMTEFGGLVVHQTNDEKLNSIGTIARNMQMKIIDIVSGKILGPNETGEACFKSPHMMIEYYNDLEKTREAVDSDGWMHTGDLCYYDENGFIFIVDRLKELLRWDGYHVPTVVVEHLIQTFPGISEKNIEKLVEDNLPDYMRLRAGVKFLDHMPYIASGKINRFELKKIASVNARCQ